LLSRTRLTLALALFIAAVASAPAASSLRPELGTFLEETCVECHDAESKKGTLDLTSLEWKPEERESFDRWVKVFDAVDRGIMPPKKKPRPDPAAAKAFIAGLGGDLRKTEGARQATTGRTVLRRLNRVEYERTVQDLLGIAIPLADLLPEDTAMHGFDTVADGLRLSTLQMEKYLEAADTALDAAIDLGPEPQQMKEHWSLKDESDVRKNLDTPIGTITNPANPKDKHRHLLRELDDGVVFFNEGYPAAQIRQMKSHPAGLYRIRISGYAYQSGSRPVAMRVYGDNYRDKQLLGWFDMPPDQARVVEFTARLRASDHLLIDPTYTGRDEKGQGVYNVPVAEFTGPGLALQWVEAEGPILDQWPPVSLKRLFGDTPLLKMDDPKRKRDRRIAYELRPEDPNAAARTALEQFATRAFRRPLEPGEIEPFVKLVDLGLEAERPFVEAMRVGFRAILTAPQFLLFEEPPGKLNDFALASRLSYFLWSTMPDDELLSAAATHRLSDPDVLHAQVERMLKDDRSQVFVKNFTGQWLDLRNIDATTPDKKLYPEADELLKVSMVQESEAFFAELLKADLNVSNLIHSDFAMLNSRLATHYEIPGVEGERFRKVSLPPESPRGGVLTQAAVLKVTANGTTTSPVLRGAWVMKRLLGINPTPPPPGIGSIEPDTRGATTVREQLAKHRDSETCAGCHREMDPPGFALESFDVIGGYRERYRSQDKGERATVKNAPQKGVYVKLGQPVDATGELPDGRSFSGIREFKHLLLTQSDQILGALAGKLVTYSTGAGISFTDREAVNAIAARVKECGEGARTLIHEVVQSPIFQTK
jgi:hypothetical protein